MVVVVRPVATQEWMNFWKPLIRTLSEFFTWVLLLILGVSFIVAALIAYSFLVPLGVLWLISLGHITLAGTWESLLESKWKTFWDTKGSYFIERALNKILGEEHVSK